MKKKIFISVGVVLLMVVWGFAYHYANQTPFQVPTEYFDKGEIVDIGLNFFDTKDENPEGYKLQLCSATLKTYSNLLAELGEKEDAVPLTDSNGYPRGDYVYDIELKIINDNNYDGYVLVSRYMLIDRAMSLEIDYNLWNILQPQAKNAPAVKIRPNTEMVIHIPFTASPRSNRHYKILTNHRMEKENFCLCISEYPIRKLININ